MTARRKAAVVKLRPSMAPAPRKERAAEIIRWWPVGKSLPRGWAIAPHQVPSHHRTYSVLIVKRPA